MTRLGWAFAAIGAVLVVGGWVLRWPPALVLGLGCLGLVAGALTVLLRRGALSVERDVEPGRVPKGGMAIAYLRVVNRAPATASATLAVQPIGDRELAVPLPRLRRGEHTARAAALPTDRRGVFEVGPVVLRRGDPFGLVARTQRQGGTRQLWVTPRVVPLRTVRTGVTRHLEGPSSDTAPQGSITFHRLREYVMGDDLRMIHWRSTARTGELMVRHNVDTSQPYTVVLVDVRPDVYRGEAFEEALDLAASVVVSSSAGSSPVRLRTTGGAVVGGPRQRDVGELLDVLTAVQPDEAGSLRRALDGVRREQGTALIVVTGDVDRDELPLVAALHRRFQRVILVSVGSPAGSVAGVPGLSVVAGEDLARLVPAWDLVAAR